MQTGRALHLVLRTQRRNIKTRAKSPTGADYYRRVPFSRTPRPTILHLETRRLFASCCCITFSSSRTTGRTRGQEILCPVKTSRGARDPGKPRRPEDLKFLDLGAHPCESRHAFSKNFYSVAGRLTGSRCWVLRPRPGGQDLPKKGLCILSHLDPPLGLGALGTIQRFCLRCA